MDFEIGYQQPEKLNNHQMRGESLVKKSMLLSATVTVIAFITVSVGFMTLVGLYQPGPNHVENLVIHNQVSVIDSSGREVLQYHTSGKIDSNVRDPERIRAYMAAFQNIGVLKSEDVVKLASKVASNEMHPFDIAGVGLDLPALFLESTSAEEDLMPSADQFKSSVRSGRSSHLPNVPSGGESNLLSEILSSLESTFRSHAVDDISQSLRHRHKIHQPQIPKKLTTSLSAAFEGVEIPLVAKKTNHTSLVILSENFPNATEFARKYLKTATPGVFRPDNSTVHDADFDNMTLAVGDVFSKMAISNLKVHKDKNTAMKFPYTQKWISKEDLLFPLPLICKGINMSSDNSVYWFAERYTPFITFFPSDDYNHTMICVVRGHLGTQFMEKYTPLKYSQTILTRKGECIYIPPKYYYRQFSTVHDSRLILIRYQFTITTNFNFITCTNQGKGWNILANYNDTSKRDSMLLEPINYVLDFKKFFG